MPFCDIFDTHATLVRLQSSTCMQKKHARCPRLEKPGRIASLSSPEISHTTTIVTLSLRHDVHPTSIALAWQSSVAVSILPRRFPPPFDRWAQPQVGWNRQSIIS